jgi:hypothetical protein
MLDFGLDGGKVARMETDPITIQEASDVTPECLTACEDVFDGWFDHEGEPIDWFAFYDRLESYGWSLANMDCPATRKIQRHIRKLRNQA